MALLRISTHVEKGALDLRVNNVSIIQDTGIYETELPVKTDYVLQWYVQGKEDSLYTIIVSSPTSAEFQLTRSLGNSGKDFGGFQFST